MKLYYLIIVILLFPAFMYSQSTDSLAEYYYEQGIEELAVNNRDSAESLLNRSLKIEKTAPALFELSKILINKKTIRDRARARELLQAAISKDPKNIKYRLVMASLMEYFSSGLAFKEYKDILQIDSTNETALLQMGEIKEELFKDYYKSVTMDNSGITFNFNDYTFEYFRESEYYFMKLLQVDPENSEAVLQLSALYESAGKPDKAIPYLVRLTTTKPNNKDAYLYLGLMYYKTSNLDSSHYAYKKALLLMNEKERKDFTFYSVKELMEPIFGKDARNISDPEMKELIDLYWDMKNPLYLSPYNERLLEHYSRVAYADLHFTIKKNNLPGWKTDRGETILRYGEPTNIIRYRPQVDVGKDNITIKAKTEVWYYPDMVYSFSDEFFNGNFQFSAPTGDKRLVSQYSGDSFSNFNAAKKVRNEIYNPQYEGPKFVVPFKIVQFKDERVDETDLYVNYGLGLPDTLKDGHNFLVKHCAGIFFFTDLYQLNYEDRDSIDALPISNLIQIDSTTSCVVNTLAMPLPADTGNFAFEIIRNADKGVSSNHLKLAVRHFSRINLGMSDIVLANNVDETNSEHYSLKRGNISILPNPLSTFSNRNKMFIYYEIYNLHFDGNGLTNFRQNIILKRIDNKGTAEKIFSPILKLVGINNEEKEVSLTSDYQTKKRDSRIYLQLDMSGYEEGDYILTIKIKDNVIGKEIEQSTNLFWR